MKEQHLGNHRQVVPAWHVVTSLILVAAIIGSFVNLSDSWDNHDNLYSASLICLITIILAIFYFFIRSFPLKAQDRAIRAEENLRHYVLTGKLLDNRLTIKQVIALRFASDDQLESLAKKAANDNLPPAEIKKLVTKWRGDYHRV